MKTRKKLASLLLGGALFLTTEAVMANKVEVTTEHAVHEGKIAKYKITNGQALVCEGEVTLGWGPQHKDSSCPLENIKKGTDLKITLVLGPDTLCDESFPLNPKKDVAVVLVGKSCTVRNK